MSRMKVLGPKDYQRMPWKNGQGMTTEIARFPADGFGRFQWRVSIADVVSAGTFSAFTGYDRFIACIEGEGMTLTVDGSPPEAVAREAQPFFFSGDAAVSCDLIGGPTRDFNLIVDRARIGGEMLRLRAGDTWAGGADDTIVLVYALRGSVGIHTGDTEIRLTEEHTARVDGEAVAVTVGPGAEALVSVVTVQAAQDDDDEA